MRMVNSLQKLCSYRNGAANLNIPLWLLKDSWKQIRLPIEGLVVSRLVGWVSIIHTSHFYKQANQTRASLRIDIRAKLTKGSTRLETFQRHSIIQVRFQTTRETRKVKTITLRPTWVRNHQKFKRVRMCLHLDLQWIRLKSITVQISHSIEQSQTGI